VGSVSVSQQTETPPSSDMCRQVHRVLCTESRASSTTQVLLDQRSAVAIAFLFGRDYYCRVPHMRVFCARVGFHGPKPLASSSKNSLQDHPCFAPGADEGVRPYTKASTILRESDRTCRKTLRKKWPPPSYLRRSSACVLRALARSHLGRYASRPLRLCTHTHP